MEKKLYIGNLPYSMTSEKLKEAFSSYGEVSEAVVVRDRETGRSRGFGFVTFTEAENADKAIEEMNGKELGDGENKRQINVSEARPPSERRGGRF